MPLRLCAKPFWQAHTILVRVANAKRVSFILKCGARGMHCCLSLQLSASKVWVCEQQRIWFVRAFVAPQWVTTENLLSNLFCNGLSNLMIMISYFYTLPHPQTFDYGFNVTFDQNNMYWCVSDRATGPGGGGGGGGGTLIFSYIRRLGSFFWFKILNFNILWGFQKTNIFEAWRFCVYFGGSSQNWTNV